MEEAEAILAQSQPQKAEIDRLTHENAILKQGIRIQVPNDVFLDVFTSGFRPP